MSEEIKIGRSPSLTPSPELRDYLNKKASIAGAPAISPHINKMYNNFRMMLAIDAIRLTDDELHALKEHLQGVYMDEIAIQSITQDVIETGCQGLIGKLKGASFGQVWATLERYELI